MSEALQMASGIFPPTPWAFEEDSGGWGWNVTTLARDEDGCVWARSVAEGLNKETASLVSAAPELFTALEELVVYSSSIIRSHAELESKLERIERAKAALRKARGEE